MGTPPKPPEIAAALEEIRESYFRELPELLDALTQACKKTRAWNDDERCEARELAHQVAGSAAVFGADELGREAAALEAILARSDLDGDGVQALRAQLARFDVVAVRYRPK